MNLPRKVKKMATLFSPIGKFWHIETICTGQDMYFQNGWSKFVKAHELQTGYMIMFRYEGNMIFKVKVFDATGCRKDYFLGRHASHVPAHIEIETSSETEDQTPRESSCGQL
jgi:B3 DNA binding domain